MRTVVVHNGARILLGKQGENNAVRVVWPGIAEKYAKLYGDGRFELVVVQNGKVYPAVVNVDGVDLIWNVLAADVAIAEIGSLELIYYVGDTIAKSQTWETFVEVSKSAEGTTEPPEPAKNWVDVVINTASDAKQSATESAESARQSAESAINAAESAAKAEDAVGYSPIVGENGNWFVWDFEKSEYVDSGKPSTTPPITPDTEGMYLTNNGSKAEWGEVNGTLMINLNKNSNGKWIIDKTFEEIQKAIDDGQVVYVVNRYNEEWGPGRPGDIVFYYRGWFSAPVGGKQYQFEANYGSNMSNYKRTLIIREEDVYVDDISSIAGDVNANYDSILKLGGFNSLNAATPNIDYALPILYVTITQDGQDSDGNPIYKSDKTYAEIKAAYDSGKEVRIKQVYTTGSFTDDIFGFLGIDYLKVVRYLNGTFQFEGQGIPRPEYGATYSFTGGQPISVCYVGINSKKIFVSLPMDFKTRLWNARVNAIPQQYLIHLNEEDNGTSTHLVADMSFDEIKTKFERTWGSTVFSVVYDNEVYAVSKTFIDSNSNTLQGFDFTNLSDTKKRLSLNNNNHWEASIRPFTAKYFFLNQNDSGDYYLSDENGNAVFPRDVSNLYGLIQYIYYQGFEYTLLNIQGPYIDFLAINRDKYAIISVDIAASYGHGTVTWSGWKSICPNQTPDVTAADNGKFLRVVNGQWTADAAGGETWEKIAEIVIPEGTDETTALTINKDSDGNPFSLVKARLCAKFPKYTGATTIPKFSFAMLNGKTTGKVAPLAYTSVWPKVSASIITGTVYEIDVSGAQQIEHVIRSGNGGWSDDSSSDYVVYGAISDTDTTWFGDTRWAKPITSIGGNGMLIYPGCRFILYGVRA